MKEQVLVYEVKRSANENADKLFNPDRKYFYWNDTVFKNLEIGDFVFVVNTHSNTVLFTALDFVAIPVSVSGEKSSFSDLGKKYNVSGKWNTFIRLKIIKELSTPRDWRWKSLGSSETTYLHGVRINAEKAENRILNINQLKQLSDDHLFNDVLNRSLKNFIGTSPKAIQNYNQIQNKTISKMSSILNAIKTKPFILLAGISGTGKSRLVRTLAYQTCTNEELRKDDKKPGNFELIPVRPNWHDSTELIGYVSRINGEKYISTTFLKFIAKAWHFPQVPFFLCLDEMNLAPVEQYFAEYLSIIETRANHHGMVSTDYLISRTNFENKELYSQLIRDLGLNEGVAFQEGISIPNNLVVIGTVNMDETTHSFSRKVLDRAMTFEMNNVNLNEGLDENKEDWSYPIEFITSKSVLGAFTAGSEVVNKYTESKDVLDYLQKLNTVMEDTPFKIAYRVRDEFLIYCYYSRLAENKPSQWLDIALDEMTSMKVLSRIEGDEGKTGNILAGMQNVLNNNYKISKAKLKEMQTRLVRSGYTSFWS